MLGRGGGLPSARHCRSSTPPLHTVLPPSHLFPATWPRFLEFEKLVLQQFVIRHPSKKLPGSISNNPLSRPSFPSFPWIPTWPSHAQSSPLIPLPPSLSLSFLSRGKSSISIERGSRGRGSERDFPKRKRIYRVSLFPLIKNKNRGKHRERRCGGLSSFVCTKRGKKLAVRILLLSLLRCPSSMDRALLSFFLFFIETADLN